MGLKGWGVEGFEGFRVEGLSGLRVTVWGLAV